MKLRIVFSLLFVGLIVGLTSLIPNNPGTAYPAPTQLIAGDGWEGLNLQANCRRSGVEWLNRAQQFEVDRFELWADNGEGEIFVFPMHFFWGNDDVEYWDTGNIAVYTAGLEWDVQGVGFHPFNNDQPVYYTDVAHINCTQIIVKSRSNLPIIKARWLVP